MPTIFLAGGPEMLTKTSTSKKLKRYMEGKGLLIIELKNGQQLKLYEEHLKTLIPNGKVIPVPQKGSWLAGYKNSSPKARAYINSKRKICAIILMPNEIMLAYNCIKKRMPKTEDASASASILKGEEAFTARTDALKRLSNGNK